MIRPYEGRSANINFRSALKPGESLRVDCPEVETNLNVANFDVTQMQDAPFIMGWVEYIDSVETRRRTYFCRRWDGHGGRYQATPDQDYEYEE